MSPIEFNYAGMTYYLVVKIARPDDEEPVTLHNEAIQYLEYENGLNELFISGSLVYTDMYGVVDKYLEEQEAYLEIVFFGVKQGHDDAVTVETYSDDNIFKGVFPIQAVNIVSRDAKCIQYKISFVSENIYQCMQVVDYSNYGKTEETPLEIIKHCINRAGLNTDKTFQDVTTNVRLNYITDGNSTLETIVPYMMNSMYYYRQKDSSFKFLMWDWFNCTYRLFDMALKPSWTCTSTVSLSLVSNADHESMIDPERAMLASISTCRQRSAMRAFFDIDMHDYDIDSNQFVREIVNQKQNLSFFNNFHADITDLITTKRTVPVRQPMSGRYVRRGTYWNNEFNFYDNFIDCLTKNNALIVDQVGEIRRMPGGIVNVQIDRPGLGEPYDSQASDDDMQSRFAGLEGMWFSHRVHSFIYPNQNKFRQNISLMRNFTIEIDKKTKGRSN